MSQFFCNSYFLYIYTVCLERKQYFNCFTKSLISNYLLNLLQQLMNNNSRVWLYQSSRLLQGDEVQEIEQKLDLFAKEWVSHSQALKADAKILHNRFILLMVDESQAGASGCSIDTSVRFMQGLGSQYNIDFFDRMNFAYMENELVKTAHKDEFSELYQQGKITDNTIVFNNLVKDVKELEEKWKVPLHESWHKNFV